MFMQCAMNVKDLIQGTMVRFTRVESDFHLCGDCFLIMSSSNYISCRCLIYMANVFG